MNQLRNILCNMYVGIINIYKNGFNQYKQSPIQIFNTLPDIV